MSYIITDALRRLGAKFQEKDANEEGWIITNAIYRTDKNPSMGVNINSGSYIDFAGKAPGGSIIDLVVITRNYSRKKAYEFVHGKGTSKGKEIPKPDTFWTEEKKAWLKECQDRLKKSPESELLLMVKEYDGLELETLLKFGCGIAQKYGQDWLVFPYETGAQLYRRENGEKRIQATEGSKPKECFFGNVQLISPKRLIIAKSPRETMLYSQELGDSYDVIGICSGEVAKISGLQEVFLKSKLQKVEKVYVSFDRDTKQAEEIAFGFSRAVRDIDNNYGLDVELLNISKLSDDKCKDFTDLIKSKVTNKKINLFAPNYDYSDPIWNTITNENRIWNVNYKLKTSISQVWLARKLKKENFGKIYFKESSEPIMVRRVDNILSQPSNNQLNDFIRNKFIKKYSKIVDFAENENGSRYIYASEIEDKYFSYDHKVLSPNYVAKLDILNVSFMKDTKESSYLFYSGKVVKVTKNSVEELNYADLVGVIWENQIINRSFSSQNNSGKDSVFAKFVSNVSGGDSKRIQSLESHIGYYLHSFKKASNTKAAIFTDEKMGPKGSANGGTGKSLVGRAIQKMRKVTFIGGKQFDPSNRFAFMEVEIGDQLVIIDDVVDGFNFESLFTVITNDMNIEAKGANRYTIPFEHSPKFLITANTPLAGSGNSHKRRQSIVEFADYYNSTFTPEVEFGHSFFDDWDAKEWNRFDNYMIHCLQVYLTSGLVTSSINYERKQLGINTDPDFVKWAEANLELRVKYNLAELFKGNAMFPNYKASKPPVNSKNEVFDSFLKFHPNVLDYNQSRTFNSWMIQYGEFKGWVPHRWPSNSHEMLIFKKKSKN